MNIKKIKSPKSDPFTSSSKNQAFERGVNLLVYELKALLTCPKVIPFFSRFLTRTIVMIMEEPCVSAVLGQARSHYQMIKGKQNGLMERIIKCRKDLGLDEILPSLAKNVRYWARRDGKQLTDKGTWKKSWVSRVPVGSRQWIKEAKKWATEQRFKPNDFSKKHGQVLQLTGLIRQWEIDEQTWYPIGTDPSISIALLLEVKDRISPHSDDIIFSSDTYSRIEGEKPDPVEVFAVELRQVVEECVKNLIAELPIIKSWGAYSVGSVDWKQAAQDLSLEIWILARATPVSEVARRIYPKIKRWNVQLSTLEKFLRQIDPRPIHERRQAQLRKKSVLKGS